MTTWLNLSLLLLLLLLPNQLGIHFWPSWSIVQGLRIDYLSPTLYLSYFLVLLYLGLTLVRGMIQKKHQSVSFSSKLLLTISVLAIFKALFDNSTISLLKISQLLLTTALVAALSKTSRFISWGWLGAPLALIWTILLALSQFFSQSSVGFWFLGERSFSLSTPGIARSTIEGQEFLRPYATFSHPNSLAGFLLVGIFLVFSLRKHFPEILTTLSLIIASVTLFFTGSRSTLRVGVLLILITIVQRHISQKTFKGLIILLFTGSLLILNLLPLVKDQSFIRRIDLQQFAITTWEKNPFFGIGLNNFIPTLGDTLPSGQYPSISSPTLWLQPVHNVFLLILSETGLLGILILATFLWKTLGKAIQNHHLLLSFLGILFLSSLDHYWFTLIQNQLLLALVFGLIWSKKKFS